MREPLKIRRVLNFSKDFFLKATSTASPILNCIHRLLKTHFQLSFDFLSHNVSQYFLFSSQNISPLKKSKKLAVFTFYHRNHWLYDPLPPILFPLFFSEYFPSILPGSQNISSFSLRIFPPSAPTSCLSEYFLRIVLLFLSEYFPTLPPLPGSQNISSFFSEYFSPLPPLLVSNSFVLVRLTVANPPWSPYWKVKEGGETLEEFESTLPSLFR